MGIASLKELLKNAIEGFHHGETEATRAHKKSTSSAVVVVPKVPKPKPTAAPKMAATEAPVNKYESTLQNMIHLRNKAMHGNEPQNQNQAVWYKGKPVVSTDRGNFDRTQMYQPQFGKPMSTPCNPFDTWAHGGLSWC